ncbi:hypothetical protein ABEB36_012164 [Hypothenemus hampei]|uniref:THAP-type domain-containing protein n=1 Tax=Hypothenemus hampei TaxID=57062 RepID=A0ABD1EA93_HYPHA
MNRSERKIKTVYNCNCCVSNCFSRKHKNKSLHFHAFPKQGAAKVNVINAYGLTEQIDRRKAWSKVLLMRKPVSPHMRVCSLHFQENDYLAKGVALLHMNRPKLKATAVPSRNLPSIRNVNIVNKVKSEQGKKNLQKRNLLSKEIEQMFIKNSETQENEVIEQKQTQMTDLTEDEKIVVHAMLDLRFMNTTFACD